eukprot:jgi/Bigna1/72176/fgenesh1_pg.18_\
MLNRNSKAGNKSIDYALDQLTGGIVSKHSDTNTSERGDEKTRSTAESPNMRAQNQESKIGFTIHSIDKTKPRTETSKANNKSIDYAVHQLTGGIVSKHTDTNTSEQNVAGRKAQNEEAKEEETKRLKNNDTKEFQNINALTNQEAKGGEKTKEFQNISALSHVERTRSMQIISEDRSRPGTACSLISKAVEEIQEEMEKSTRGCCWRKWMWARVYFFTIPSHFFVYTKAAFAYERNILALALDVWDTITDFLLLVVIASTVNSGGGAGAIMWLCVGLAFGVLNLALELATVLRGRTYSIVQGAWFAHGRSVLAVEATKAREEGLAETGSTELTIDLKRLEASVMFTRCITEDALITIVALLRGEKIDGDVCAWVFLIGSAAKAQLVGDSNTGFSEIIAYSTSLVFMMIAILGLFDLLVSRVSYGFREFSTGEGSGSRTAAAVIAVISVANIYSQSFGSYHAETQEGVIHGPFARDKWTESHEKTVMRNIALIMHDSIISSAVGERQQEAGRASQKRRDSAVGSCCCYFV